MRLDTGRKPAPPAVREVDQLAESGARGHAAVMAVTMRPASELMVEFSTLLESRASDADVITRAREIEEQLPAQFKALRVESLERYLRGRLTNAYRAGRRQKRRAFQEANA